MADLCVVLSKRHLGAEPVGMTLASLLAAEVFNMKGLKHRTEFQTDLTPSSAAGMNVCLMVDRKLSQIRPLPPAYTYTLLLSLHLCTYLCLHPQSL